MEPFYAVLPTGYLPDYTTWHFHFLAGLYIAVYLVT